MGDGDYTGPLDWDPELPAGYQDADIEQAALEQEGRRLTALHKRGICTHGWCLGKGTVNRSRPDIEADRRGGTFPDRPTDPSIQEQSDIPDLKLLCLDCGQLVDDPVAQTDD
jgi:hypothetical protein